MGTPLVNRKADVRAKLFLVMAGLAVTISVGLTLGAWHWHERTATRELEKKTLTYGQLLTRSLDSAIAFDDPVTAREELAAITVDADIAGVGLYHADGSLLESRGDVRGLDPGIFRNEPELLDGPTTIVQRSPVLTREGPRGTVVVVVSKAGLQEQLSTLRAIAALFAACTILAGCAVAWWLSRNLAARIGTVAAAAAAVAAGELTRPAIEDGSTDEIGQLAAAFNTMVAELRRLVGQIESTAAEEQARLERLVDARTAELAGRNAAMRLLLDHVGEGFLLLDAEGRIGAERSAIVDEWFGAPPLAVRLWDHLAVHDPSFAAWFELAWDNLAEDFLPLEAIIDSFPKRLRVGERSFEVSVAPIVEASVARRTLVDIRDVTPQIERERVENAQREVLALLERALEDGPAYIEFLAEASNLIVGIAHERFATSMETKRAVHTLKGNFGLFGLTSLASFCHEIESRMTESNGLPSANDRAELARRWDAATSRLAQIFSRKSTTVSVDSGELDTLLDELTQGIPRTDIVRRIQRIRLEPLEVRLHRFAEQAGAVAQRLGKEVTVEIDSGGIRIEPGVWNRFFTGFTHVVRNAVDHGIELPTDRAAAGKPRVGRLSFRASVDANKFMFEAADDGAGVDWGAVAARAAERGLPSTSRADLEAALFADGISTRAEVSELSGRGVGLAAVREGCTALGGTVTVLSERGLGTRLCFVFPRDTLGEAYRTESPTVHEAA